MTGDITLEAWTALLIAGAVALGVTRLALWRRSTPPGARGPAWRLGALIALQIVAGGLLYLTLFPPRTTETAGRLIIATRGAAPKPATGDVVVALPEAKDVAGLHAPDLGSALRQHPRPGRLRIEGEGLVPRDRIALDRPAEFAPPPTPRGFVEVTTPETVAAGGRFQVAGSVQAPATSVVELVDPAGAIVDRAQPGPDARFRLSAAARAPGLALFDLRLRDAAGRLVERIDIPVETRAPRAPRVLAMAGAPSAETKQLARWAKDAGVDLGLQISLGGGVQLGDTPTPSSRAALAEYDLVVIDDRRWESLEPGTRAALDAAVQNGLGLLLRPTGPISDATRRDWTRLGLSLGAGESLRPIKLDASPDQGPNAPDLHQIDLLRDGAGLAAMVQDKDGRLLAGWRPRGQGRVGVWTVVDSYRLVQVGQADRYGDLWSRMASILARPGETGLAWPQGVVRQGERMALCHVPNQLVVIAPDGVAHSPIVDPVTDARACAAYWPSISGWHEFRSGDTRLGAIYVHPANAAPSLARADNRRATMDLIEAANAKQKASSLHGSGSPWPWAAALFAVLCALWWLERRPPKTP